MILEFLLNIIKSNDFHDISVLGEACEINSQCYLESEETDRVECRNGICQCGYIYTQTQDLDCKSGEYCRNTWVLCYGCQERQITTLLQIYYNKHHKYLSICYSPESYSPYIIKYRLFRTVGNVQKWRINYCSIKCGKFLH